MTNINTPVASPGAARQLSATVGPVQAKARRHSFPWHWLIVLGVGFALFAAVAVAVVTTHDPILVPSLLLVGAAVVPATLTTLVTEVERSSALTLPRVLTAAVLGGVAGGVLAGVLEFATVGAIGSLPYLAIGLIEESVKLAIPVGLFTWGTSRGRTVDGLILGVAAGSGFAALETAGYGFVALLQTHGQLTPVAGLLLSRALASLGGHAAWTGLAAGAWFSIRGARKRWWGWVRFLATLALVVCLHALWDANVTDGLYRWVGGLSFVVLVTTAAWLYCKGRITAPVTPQAHGWSRPASRRRVWFLHKPPSTMQTTMAAFDDMPGTRATTPRQELSRLQNEHDATVTTMTADFMPLQAAPPNDRPSDDRRMSLGMEVHGTDGRYGHLAGLLINATSPEVTHVVVARNHHRAGRRLLPVERLRLQQGILHVECSVDEIDASEPIDQTEFVKLGEWPHSNRRWNVGVVEVRLGYEPWFGSHPEKPMGPDDLDMVVRFDRIPPGTVEVRSSSEAFTADHQLVGHLTGVVIDSRFRITHLVLRRGHRWARVEIQVPDSDVADIANDAFYLDRRVPSDWQVKRART